MRTVALLAVLLAVSCGPSREERLGRAAAEAAEPVVRAFVADLEAARFEDARGRATEPFRAEVDGEEVRAVALPMRAVLGALSSRTLTGAAADAPSEEEDLPSRATLTYATRWAKGDGTMRVRVLRGADGTFRIDGWVLETPALTYTLRR